MSLTNPSNARVYYPIQAIGFGPLGTPIGTGVNAPTGRYTAAKGVQSVGFNTSFNLEQVYELGQISIYENIENLPNVELNVSKVIDGYALLEHLATPTATTATLAGRYNSNRCMAAVAYYNISQEFSSGVPLSIMVMSGLYVSAINWAIPVEGNMTESITLVANDKTWYTAPSGNLWTAATLFAGSESPITGVPSGGVQRRENVDIGNSYFPLGIPGISGNNLSGKVQVYADGSFSAHVQSINIGCNLGRTDLFELGRKGPYFRYANFPTEVTCSIEVTADEYGDRTNASSTADNLVDERIYIALTQGVTIDLGVKNKLQNVQTNGGDTGGGNVTLTYNYSNFNDMTIRFTAKDPAGL